MYTVGLRGSGVNDFARLESWCVNHELRRANDMKMLHIYYDRLKLKAGDKFNATFEQMEKLYREASALNGILGAMMVDFLLQNVAKIDEDETGWRKKELLSRFRAGYDDAAKYYGWSTTKCQSGIENEKF